MLVFNKEKLLDFFFLVKIHTQTQAHTYILTLSIAKGNFAILCWRSKGKWDLFKIIPF